MDCNDCFCEKGGAPGCTLRGCIHKTEPEIVSIQLEPEKEILTAIVKPSDKETTMDSKCTPGSSWTEVCNTCWCTDDGKPYCTKIGCVNLAGGGT